MALREGTSEELSVGGLIDEQQVDKRLDQKIAHEGTVIFNMFDRLVTMLRVYPKGHPLLDELGAAIAERINRSTTDFGDIEVRVGAHQLSTFHDTPFFSVEESEKSQYIWYNAYADGLQKITLINGIQSKEIQDFLGVINKSHSGNITSDDDTITLLWELSLEHITYFAVEGFVDNNALDNFSNMTEPEAIHTIADAAIDPRSQQATQLHTMFANSTLIQLDIFTRMQIESQQKMIIQELKDTDLAYAFGVDAELIKKLLGEWSSGIDLEYRLIEALLSIVRTSPTSDAGQNAANLVSQVTRQLLEKDMFEQAARILELLHNRRELFSQTAYDPLGDLINELSDPMQLEAMLHTLQVNTKQRDAIVKLLLLLGPSKVLKQILTLFADEKRKVVALPQLVDIVEKAVSTENESMLLAPEYVKSVTYFTRLLGELADRDLSGFSPTPRLIRAALALESAQAQALALSLEHPVFQDLVLAEKYLRPLSLSTNEDLRKNALRKLAEYHPVMFKETIRDSLLAREFRGRTHAELRFLMRVFVESVEEARPMLRSMCDIAGWFKSGHREFAKMAASVLLEFKDPEVQNILTKRSKAFWTHPDLRRSYSQSLTQFGLLDVQPQIATSVAQEEPHE